MLGGEKKEKSTKVKLRPKLVILSNMKFQIKSPVNNVLLE